MKYVSLDIETTSLIPDHNNILMVSMVVEDSSLNPLPPVSELPHFTCFIKDPKDEYKGQAYALGLNGWILDILSGRTPNNTPFEVLHRHDDFSLNSWTVKAINFLMKHFPEKIDDTDSLKPRSINMAGKNAGIFDYQFLPECFRYVFSHKIIDPGSVFVNWDNYSLPNLPKLLKDFGIREDASHNAYVDACDVIRILRKSYKK